MTIPAIGAVQAAGPFSIGEHDLSIRGALAAASGAASTDGAAFGESLSGAIDGLQQLQSTSNELAIKAVTGDLDDIHDATIASTRAAVTLELIAAVRNKGVEAFNEIMRMQA
ncbi:flagellar hook-basal body complex protein FliE [Salinibacterium sp. SYSU T00001]|uniref:flagellar hook-basal body complex protein FliE n=1 Tax=Homoserinimonas sedimenticola TaxID=2986805 RepID=UPI0022365649|nr:flagellar hook-basal body complex protein FliE [Salinibacterium sedimenticola]MCW4385736.1 flagellar hook-basal body complex protein FliE [Salinibacterium sedimenticola]